MNPQIDPNEQDAVVLWAEIWRLRTALRGPDGYATWQDAAVAERARRIQAERSASARVALSDKVLSLLAKVPLPPKAITYEYGRELLDALQECAVIAEYERLTGITPAQGEHGCRANQIGPDRWVCDCGGPPCVPAQGEQHD